MTQLLLDGVSKVYPGGHHAVDRLRLRVDDGELFVLLGPSGCGKSTVLRMIAGLEEITQGDLWLDDIHANELAPKERNIAMIFQNGALYPHLSVRGNLSFPLEMLKGGDAAATRERVVEMARALGIDSMLDRRPATLSGGQRQRVAMGRAMVREPTLFLMDEPLSSLDAALRAELRMEIGSLVRALGVTTVYVTHDQVEALTLADRIAIMDQGVLQDVGTPQQLYDDPATTFVAAFLSSPQINLLQATGQAIQGEGLLLHLGPQRLCVPWTDRRAPSLMGCHGKPLIIGIRPDSLRLSTADDPGPLLSGRLRALEFHGHEWLAHAEAGIPSVDAESAGAPPRPPGPPPRRTTTWWGRQRPPETPAPSGQAHGHHRRSDLVFRAGSGRGLNRGETVHLAVDLDRILIFDQDGRRVDPVHR
ncbi:MAG: Multiple sugar transport system ATP-binding protein [Streptosporangiaceae bacterium]|nr:Multiple sugar transport system ATP-binding protein [Streptosporangiaceae bacterium]